MTIKKLSIFFIALALPFALISCSDDPVSANGDNGDNGNGNGDGNGGVTEKLEFPITFEEDLPWDDIITNFDGGELSVVDNPDKSGINNSDKVAKMVKGDGQPWAGAVILLPESINFDNGTDFTVSVWAPRANTKMLLKIENEEEGSQAFERELTVAESQEWVDITFSLAAANESYTYEKLVFIFDLGTVGDGSDDFTWYFDNIRQAEGDGNGGSGEAVTLPVTFDDDNVDYGLTDFGGNESEIVTDPTDGSNKVVETKKTAGAEEWAGTTVGGEVGFADPIPFTSSVTTMSVRVWSPTADTPIRLKVEDANDPTISVETETNTTVAEEWETLVFDFSNEAAGTAALNLSSNYNKASIFFNFGTTGGDAGEQTYYWDDVEFGGDAGNGNGGDPGTAPTSAAPTPTVDEANVISVFSDAYTDIADTDFNPNWGQATQVTFVEIEGNETMKYSNLNYQGIELGSNQDVSGMDYLHIDVWTENSTALNAFIISPGVETAYALDVPTSGWLSIDIPLSEFSPVDLADVFQFKFEGNGDIFIDNIYFWKDDNGNGGDPGTAPTSAAPTPTVDVANVISVFSDAYDDISGTEFFPNWGQETQVSFVNIEGNETMLYTGLNYQGTELGSNQDVSDYDYVHIDFWTQNSTELNFFLISPGPVEKSYALTVPTEGWSSVNIPLSEFSPVDLEDIFQLMFTGNGDIYLDNIYFWKDDSGNGGNGGNGDGGQTAPKNPIDFETGGFGADWEWTVFENDTNPELEIIANPDKSAPNTSDTVAKFTALETGGAFAGFETVEGQLGEFLFTDDNCIVRVDVWKAVTSNVGVKFDTGAPPNDWGTTLVTSANSETEQWETLTFNFCEVSPELRNPNPADGFGGLKRIAIFPDNVERSQDNVIYIDNITFSAE